VLVAATHGAIFGVGAILATHLVSADRAGRAVAVLLAGVTVANVLGVPAGAAIGTALGWRASFWSVGVLGVVAILAVLLLVPKTELVQSKPVGLLAQVNVLFRPVVFLSFLVLIFGMTGQFALLTYIVPVLHEVSGLDLADVPWLLLCFGIGSTLGVFVGGRLSDWWTLPSLVGILIAQAVTYGVIALAMDNGIAMGVLMVIWGAVGFAFGAPAQARILGASRDAPNLASTLIPSAYNVGIAVGAVVGSQVLEAGGGYTMLPFIGGAASVLAAAIAALSGLGRTAVKSAEPISS
jgi:DHA1 family inner membrane transport protein